MLTGEKFNGVVRLSASARPRPSAEGSDSGATESSDFADGVLLGLVRSPRRLLAASGALVFFQNPGGFREVHAFDIPAGTRPQLRRFFDRNRSTLDETSADHSARILPFGEGFVAILPLDAGGPGHFLGVWFDRRTKPLSRRDLALLDVLASQAGAAILQDEAAHVRVEAAVAADRRRIARDLHDVVVQRVFAAGLQLRSAAGRVEEPVKDELDRILVGLDETITAVRAAIFDLTRNPHTHLDANARALLEEYLAFFSEPSTLLCEGDLGLVSGRVADQTLAVMRELLSNAARHSGATTCRVSIAVDAEGLTLTVADDGRGIDPKAPHSGLENVRLRAVVLGGTLELTGREPSGAVVTWQVPLDEEPLEALGR